MNSEVVALWERAAETCETEVPYFALMGERIVALAHIEAGESVLDVACGMGATAIPAARQAGPAGRVVGIDIVPAMVEATRLAARDAGLDNVSAEVMDGEALGFDDLSFDVVICAFGLGFLRPEVALPEMARVLRRPGRLIASAPTGGGPNWEFFGELCERYGVASAAHPGGTKMPTPDETTSVFAQGRMRAPWFHGQASRIAPGWVIRATSPTRSTTSLLGRQGVHRHFPSGCESAVDRAI